MGKLSVEKKEAKKDKIIEKSMELFCEKGYYATKVEEITKALGISKGNFYTYFGSKEEVLYEILNIMKNERIKMLEEIDTNKAPKEVLRDFIEDHSQIFFKYLKRVNLKNIDSFLKDEKVVNYMEEVQGILTEFLKKNIIERIEGSQNKEYNLRFIIDFILMSMDGFFLDESLIEELEIKRKYELTMENKINQITEFIYNALK
jgi:tetR/acrR family transcriptional regulator